MGKKIHLTLSELRRALEVTLITASTDDTLPILTTIHVVKDTTGVVMFESTDRYRLGRVMAKATGSTSVDALIPVHAAKDMLWVIKKAQAQWRRLGNKGIAVLDFTSEHVTLFAGGYADQYTLRALLTEGEFPKIGHIYEKFIEAQAEITAGTRTAKPFAGFNPGYLGDMAKIGSWSDPNLPIMVALGDRPAGPAMFYAGDWFLGALMPVRVEEPPKIGKDSLFTSDKDTLKAFEAEISAVVEDAFSPIIK